MVEALVQYQAARQSLPLHMPGDLILGHPAMVLCLAFGNLSLGWVNRLLDRDGLKAVEAIQTALAKGEGKGTQKLWSLLAKLDPSEFK
jgi:hypothetical protein